MSKGLTFLFFPLEGHGHINCCHGIAEVLRDRNHRVVFAIDAAFKGKLSQYGFEEEILSMESEGGHAPGGEAWPEFIRQYADVLRAPPLAVIESVIVSMMLKMSNKNQQLDSQYAAIISKVKPDVIIIDMYVGCPTLTHSGIPWVWLYSAAPHEMFNSDQIPPAWSEDQILRAISSLPVNDQNGWKEFERKRNKIMNDVKENIDNYYLSKNLPKLPANRLHPQSPYLNIYMYPKELDYDQLICLPKTYLRVDTAVRTTSEQFSIPESLVEKPGKLIFLSMGSNGSGDIELMIRLTNILSKSPNRFIVSKGASHDKYDLPDNMWGQRMVPQTKVLPLVDLVIHHGGNNTLTETFYFGKPMIVMPLLCDQIDNAQRVSELGYGVRLSPYHCTEEELLNAVDGILSDDNLTAKMRSIGERIRNMDYKEKVADRMESIVK